VLGLKFSGFVLGIGAAVYGGQRADSWLFGLFVFAMVMHVAARADNVLTGKRRLRSLVSLVVVPGAGTLALWGSLAAWDRYWLASLIGFAAASLASGVIRDQKVDMRLDRHAARWTTKLGDD
jgi:hypothetical protein